MKRTAVEKNIVVVLFVLVLVTFSLAQRDSQRLQQFSTAVTEKVQQMVAKF